MVPTADSFNVSGSVSSFAPTTVPRSLLTSHRPESQGSCPPGGRHTGGPCRRCRLTACWRRSCHPPCQPGSGCPGCWPARPLLAGGEGEAGWLLPVSGFHAVMGGRIRQPEAGNRRKDLTELTAGVECAQAKLRPQDSGQTLTRGTESWLICPHSCLQEASPLYQAPTLETLASVPTHCVLRSPTCIAHGDLWIAPVPLLSPLWLAQLQEPL